MRNALAVLLLVLAVTGCYADEGEPTGALCDRQVTYEEQIAPLMRRYCGSCHAQDVPLSGRHGAPGDHNFDTEQGVIDHADAIALRAAAGVDAINRSMPPRGFGATPSDAERMLLGRYLACLEIDGAQPAHHH